jgi:hypothetical protein
VANPSDVEARLAALGVKVDANRVAINALGVQTAARFYRVDQPFDGVDQRFASFYQRFDRLEDEMRTGFAEMGGKLDQAAAGQQQIVDLLTGQGTRQTDE